MLRKNFNVKFKMKQVAGGEVRPEVVSHCVREEKQRQVEWCGGQRL